MQGQSEYNLYARARMIGSQLKNAQLSNRLEATFIPKSYVHGFSCKPRIERASEVTSKSWLATMAVLPSTVSNSGRGFEQQHCKIDS